MSGIDSKVSMALDLRLELRTAFLRSIYLMTRRMANPDSLKMPWIQMKGLLSHFSKQHELATPVPAAFSTKLQRRLASTMPPRPIIQLSFDETVDHFIRMSQDGMDITDILRYSDTQSLMVSIDENGLARTSHSDMCCRILSLLFRHGNLRLTPT